MAPLSRPLRSLLCTALALAAVGALGSTTVVASATVAPTSRPVTGDVTGDGLADQVTLGADTAVAGTCSARVKPGLATGGFGGGAYRALPIRGVQLLFCPDLGVVVPGPTPARNRLAVAWSSVPPLAAKSVQFFRWDPATRAWTYDGGTNGQYQPSSLSSRDVDGDGFGDLVEFTDQGAGVSVFAGRGSTYRQVWTSSPSTADLLTYADFDHGPGVDFVDAHAFFGSLHVGVTVVDGATGTTTALVTDTSDAPSSYTPRVVDVDHDGWPDVRIGVVAADGTTLAPIVFRNRADGTLRFRRV